MARRRLQPRFFLFVFSLLGIGAGVFLLVQALVSRPEQASAEATPAPSATATPQPGAATPAPPLPDGLRVGRSLALRL